MSSFMQSSAFVHTLERLNKKWELQEIIGEGTYGEVHKAINKKKEYAAVKVVENHPSKLDELQSEINIFKKFPNHPNMVKYYGTYLFTDEEMRPTQIWLVMEYCEGRSVSELAKAVIRNGKGLHENNIKYLTHQTLQGIKYLHTNHVMHRDIKGPNILLTITGEVKLIDYGVSSELRNTMERRNSSVGSPFWMAPEVIACEQQLDYNYNNKCDIWSLGITAIELADGDPPYAEEHPMKALFKIPRNPSPTVRDPSKWSEHFLAFIAYALLKDFEQRPSAKEMLNHEFLDECIAFNLETMRKEVMALLHITLKIVNIPNKGSNTMDDKKKNALKNDKVMETDDLAKLSRITEEVMVEYLVERYNGDQIYTYVGEILIVCNPFKNLGIYGHGASILYQNSRKEDLPPHVYMIASNAYHAMLQKNTDQCCVINGESGSGKTVTASHLLHQFAHMGKFNVKLVKKILQINTLLEAFGNAQTTINQNSSRFGKFLELHFTSTGVFVGAQLSEYLLEKSRVVSQPSNERNFHIFYYMIAGLEFQNKLESFHMSSSSSYRYLNTDELSLSECACTSEMQVRFAEVQACLENIGFSTKEIQNFYSVLAAIICLGDIDFSVDNRSIYEGEKSQVSNENMLHAVADLLKVNKRSLGEALTTNSSITAGEIIKRNNNIEQALDCRDATAKVLYNRLFIWIVKRINGLLRAVDLTQSSHSRIAILDIFGFENFKTNSFEQLCINVANEQLQFYFNEYIFVWEFEEYAAEGIKATTFEFTNNKKILDLCLQKPVGILALLDEESRFPMATDMTLVEKYIDNLQSSYFKTTRESSTSFLIKHYAGEVVYDTTGFLEKNRDTLSVDVIETIQASHNETIAQLIEESAASILGLEKPTDRKRSLVATTNRFHQTVSTHFRLSLRNLMSKVIRSEPHFVRCIRPNIQNLPDIIDSNMVLHQLKCTGVLETIKIRQKGYSERIPFDKFVDMYRFISYKWLEEVPREKETCVKLLKDSGIDDKESWGIGRTKVFLRYWQVQRLRTMKATYMSSIVKIQKAISTCLYRRRLRTFLKHRHDAANKIINTWKRYRWQKDFNAMKAAMTSKVKNSLAEKSDVVEQEKRPFYRNYQRDEIDYLNEDEHSKKGRASSFNSMMNGSNGSNNGDDLEDIDPEGRAALEETRSIILLLQIEMTSKEIYDVLDRTSYPVIHSIRNSNQGGDSETPKMKPQKLNVREKQIAMLDGYSNPLQQRFRHAQMHTQNELANQQEEAAEFAKVPMLGLVDKPMRDAPVPSATAGPKSPDKQTAPQGNNNKKTSFKKENPKPKPSTVSKNKPPPANTTGRASSNKVVATKPAVTKDSVSKGVKGSVNRFQSVSKEVKAQNQLKQSEPKQKKPQKSDDKPTSVRRHQPASKKQQVQDVSNKTKPNKEKENEPPKQNNKKHTMQKRNPPVFGSENKVMKEKASYEDKIRKNINNKKEGDSVSRYPSASSQNSSFAIPTTAVRERQRIPTSADSVQRRFKQPPPVTNNHQPYNYLNNNRRDQSKVLHHVPVNGLNSRESIDQNAYNRPPRRSAANAGKKSPPSLPANATSQRQNQPSRQQQPRQQKPTDYSRTNYPAHNFKTPTTGRKKVLHGFNYGPQNQNELQGMRLNRTGLLQQLVK